MNILEQYITEMESRSSTGVVDAPNYSEDLWTQLQQKENDLQIAAELGKALLEKNKELEKQNEAIIEEYSKKLEVSAYQLCFMSTLKTYNLNIRPITIDDELFN